MTYPAPIRIRHEYDAETNTLKIIKADTGQCFASLTPKFGGGIADTFREAPPTKEELSAVIGRVMADLRAPFVEVVQ